MNRRTASRALAAFCALALVGCNGGEPQAEGSSTTTSASASSTTTTTAPSSPTTKPTPTASVSIPAAARAHTEGGAEAFARFFIEVANHSQTSADSSRLRAISEPSCEGCDVYADLADEMRAKKQRTDVGALSVAGVLVRPGSTGDVVVMDLLLHEKASKVLDQNGSTVQSFGASKLTLRTTTAWRSDRWRITQALLVK